MSGFNERARRKARKFLESPRRFLQDALLHQQVSAALAEWRARRLVVSSSGAPQPRTRVALVELLRDCVGCIEYRSDCGAARVGVLLAKRRAALQVLLVAAERSGGQLELRCNPAGTASGHRESTRDRVSELLECHSWLAWEPEYELTIEFWRELPEAYLAPTNNMTARKLYKSGAAHLAFGVGQRFDLSSVNRCTPFLLDQRAIDLVVTWVNDADPEWRAMFGRYVSAAGEQGARKAFFHNRDELRYLLRSITVNAPWFRTVHVVTNCKLPAWLDPSADRLNIVQHAEILPREFLPTFNSHAIEAALHKIPGLSPLFVYANDDMLFTSPCFVEDFFTSNGLSKSFFEPYAIINGQLDSAAPAFINAARNGKALLEQAIGYSATRLHEHVPYALRTDTLREIEERFAEEIQRTQASRFRSATDLSLTSFLYHHYAFATQRSVEAQLSHGYVSLGRDRGTSPPLPTGASAPKIVCLNDSSHATLDLEEGLRASLESAFPQPSSFERRD